MKLNAILLGLAMMFKYAALKSAEFESVLRVKTSRFSSKLKMADLAGYISLKMARSHQKLACILRLILRLFSRQQKLPPDC